MLDKSVPIAFVEQQDCPRHDGHDRHNVVVGSPMAHCRYRGRSIPRAHTLQLRALIFEGRTMILLTPIFSVKRSPQHLQVILRGMWGHVNKIALSPDMESGLPRFRGMRLQLCCPFPSRHVQIRPARQWQDPRSTNIRGLLGTLLILDLEFFLTKTFPTSLR